MDEIIEGTMTIQDHSSPTNRKIKTPAVTGKPIVWPAQSTAIPKSNSLTESYPRRKNPVKDRLYF